MVITISCPSCLASFPVDPQKIPEAGVSVRCSSCSEIFRVERPSDPEPLPTLEDLTADVAAPEAEMAAPEAEMAAPEAETAAPEAEMAAPEPSKPAVQGFTFGKRDPTDKAKRLARVLVSDMIMYNAERHQSALAAGTLVQDFEEEIDKSWKEYVEQVGEDLANGDGRQFWTQALNDILAKGQEVF